MGSQAFPVWSLEQRMLAFIIGSALLRGSGIGREWRTPLHPPGQAHPPPLPVVLTLAEAGQVPRPSPPQPHVVRLAGFAAVQRVG